MNIFRKITKNVRRKQSQGYTGAFGNADTETTFQIRCSFQPLEPDEMKIVPEGRRDEESFKLYTNTELLTAESNGNNPDIVEHDGQDFEVISCGDYHNKLIEHYKVICVRMKS